MPDLPGVSAHRPTPIAPPPSPQPTAAAEGADRTEGAQSPMAFLDGVDAPRDAGRSGQCTSHTQTTRQRNVERAMHTLVDGNVDALGDLVTSDRRVLGALGRMSSDRLTAEVGGTLDRGRTSFTDRFGGNFFLRQTAVGRVEARVEQGFREMVRNETIHAVDDVVRTIGRTDTAALARELAAAEPGTQGHAMAERLGVRGAPGDEARLRGSLRDLVGSVRDFREHLFGGTWEPSDFPQSTQRALCRLGMQDAPEGSILANAIGGDRHITDAVHLGQIGVEAGHAVVETAHVIAHPGLLTAGPLAVTVGGIVFGLAVHHAVGENIEERREFAAELGL